MTFLEKFINNRMTSQFLKLDIVKGKVEVDDFMTLIDPKDEHDPIYGVDIVVATCGKTFAAKARKGHVMSYGAFDIVSDNIVVKPTLFDFRSSYVELFPEQNKAVVTLKPTGGVQHVFGAEAAEKFVDVQKASPLMRVCINGGPTVYAADVQFESIRHFAFSPSQDIIEIQGDIDALSSFKRTIQRRKVEMDEGVLSGTYAHGICAYVGTLNKVPELIKKMQTGIKGGICCTRDDQFIGPIGVYVRGDVQFASPVDLYSWIDRNTGERFFDATSQLCRNRQELHFDELLTEVVVSNSKVVGLWVDTRFLEAGGKELEDAIKKIASKFNIHVKEVSGRKKRYRREEILQAIAEW